VINAAACRQAVFTLVSATLLYTVAALVNWKERESGGEPAFSFAFFEGQLLIVGVHVSPCPAG
jgi:hypothetical protein